MTPRPAVATVRTLIALLLAAVAVSVFYDGPAGVVSWLAYGALALLPGTAAYCLVCRRPRVLDLILAGVIISPVLIGAIGAATLYAGIDDAGLSLVLAGVTAACGAVTIVRISSVGLEGWPGGRRAGILFGTIAFFVVIAVFLPLKFEYWRYWSDAWFHSAVVQQIQDFGVPPEDPYFLGFDLQYMWLFHIIVIAGSSLSGLDPTLIMPLSNAGALIGLALSAYLLAVSYRPGFIYGYMALLFVVLGLNAVVWLFLPISVAYSMIGETSGWAELTRVFALVPFDERTVQRWLRPHFNQTFLLNKFIVATAFSLGLAYMAAFWYAAVRSLKDDSAGPLTLLFFSTIGAIAFHSFSGFMMLSATAATFFIMLIARRAIVDFSFTPLLRMSLVISAGVALTAPYLYSVVHVKESGALFPFVFMFNKTSGIIISTLLVTLLAAVQLPRLWRAHTMATTYLLLAGAVTVVVANLIRLPDSNTYDKPVFFIFYPLAIVASWTFAERIARPFTTARYRRRVWYVVALLLVPVNVFAVAGYYNTERTPVTTDGDRALSAWVRDNTSRDAVFFQPDDGVLLLVTGPRRYYYGRTAYARQWGYPSDEMQSRRDARDNIYSANAPDRNTLQALAGMAVEVFVVVPTPVPYLGKFERYSQIFERVYRDGTIDVYRVNRDESLRMSKEVTP